MSLAADYFSLQMDTNTSLTHLQLASNGLGKGGVTWLAQVLRFVPGVRRWEVLGLRLKV